MEEKVTNPRITVMLLGSGFAAVQLVDVEDKHGKYTDVQQTGIGRYAKRDKAVIEAKQWAKAEELPLEDVE